MMEKNKLPAIDPPVAERAGHLHPPHAPASRRSPSNTRFLRWTPKGLAGIGNGTQQLPTHAMTHSVAYTHASQISPKKYKLPIKECTLQALENHVRSRAFLVEILLQGKPSRRRANLEENKHSDTVCSPFLTRWFVLVWVFFSFFHPHFSKSLCRLKLFH